MNKKKLLYILLFISVLVLIIIGIVLITNKKTTANKQSNQNENTQDNIEKSTSTENTDSNNIIDIKEKMFIQQVNDVFVNLKQYEGKKLRIQGFIYHELYDNKSYYYVMRNTPGCCGNDGSAGLEISWDQQYPADNEWVETVGTVKSRYDDYYHQEIPVLQLISLDVKQERGKDFVTQ